MIVRLLKPGSEFSLEVSMKLITFLRKSSSIKLLTRLLSWDWWNHPWISLVIITGRIRAFSRAVWVGNKTWGVVTVFPWNFLTKFPGGMGKVQSRVRGELIQFHRVEFKIIHSSLVSATCCDLGSHYEQSLSQVVFLLSGEDLKIKKIKEKLD